MLFGSAQRCEPPATRNEGCEVTKHDTITLTGIRGHGYHGVFEKEREQGQEFHVDVTVHLDTRPAAASDDLNQTIDYGDLANEIHRIITGPPVELIETLAQSIANSALKFTGIQAVDVAVSKPYAPIEVPFSDVIVRIHRTIDELVVEPEQLDELPQQEPSQQAPPPPPELEAPAPQATGDVFDQRPERPAPAVLALGANLGEAQQTLISAIRDIEAVAEIELVDVSPLARTAPVGPEQPDFYNCVVRVLTTLTPRELLQVSQEIEAAHGRERNEHWGPRTLDIDVITFGSAMGVSADLELPHPRAHERAFVLAPWAQLEPNAVLPGLGGGPIATLAASAPDRDGIRWMALDWLS